MTTLLERSEAPAEMDELEYCHILEEDEQRTLCGHHDTTPTLCGTYRGEVVCPYCGFLNCPRCIEIDALYDALEDALEERREEWTI